MTQDPRKTLAERAKGIAALPGEKLAELKAFGAEKVQETLGAFLSALPALKRAGYDLRDVSKSNSASPPKSSLTSCRTPRATKTSPPPAKR